MLRALPIPPSNSVYVLPVITFPDRLSLNTPPERVAAPLADIFESHDIPTTPPFDKLNVATFSVPGDTAVKFSVVPFPTDTLADPPLTPLLATESVPAFKFTVPPLSTPTVLDLPASVSVTEPPLIVPLLTAPALTLAPVRISPPSTPTTRISPWSTPFNTLASLANVVLAAPERVPIVIVPVVAVNASAAFFDD
jgi:hypothetical protein